MTTARFDDLTPGQERAFAFADPIAVIEARRPDEVAGVLSAAEAAAERGSWVAGYVAYDAAPGLDADHAIAPRASDDPFADLPPHEVTHANLLWPPAALPAKITTVIHGVPTRPKE